MAKTKTMWYCTSCGADSPKWEGRCPSCGQWGTMVEEKVSAKPNRGSNSTRIAKSVPQKVSEIQAVNEPRIHMPSEELNRVLGGRIVGAYRRRARHRQVYTRFAKHTFNKVKNNIICVGRGECNATENAR